MDKKLLADKKQAAAAAATAAAYAAAMEEEDEAAAEEEELEEQPLLKKARPNTAEEEELRRGCIIRKFKTMREPPEEEWDGKGGVVAQISKWLDDPPGHDVRPIRRTLERYCAGDPLVLPRSGRPLKLQEGAAVLAADCRATLRLSEEQTALFLANVRAERGFDKPAVSRKAVHNAWRRCDGLTRPRGTRHQGAEKTDAETDWCKARKLEAEQRLVQLGKRRRPRSWSRQDEAPSVDLEGVFMTDETHLKIVLGDDDSTVENVLPEGPDGEFLCLEEGGEYPEPNRRLVVKCPADGPRGCCAGRRRLRAAAQPGVITTYSCLELSMYVFCACTSMWGSLLAQWRAEARVLKARETNLGRLWYGTVHAHEPRSCTHLSGEVRDRSSGGWPSSSRSPTRSRLPSSARAAAPSAASSRSRALPAST